MLPLPGYPKTSGVTGFSSLFPLICQALPPLLTPHNLNGQVGTDPQAGWGLGFWKDLSNAVRSLGSVGTLMTMLGTKATSALSPRLLSAATMGSVPLSRMLPMTESLASAQYSRSLW